MTTTHTTGTNWQARMSEANDAIGAARDALRRARTHSEIKAAEKDLAFWLQQKAHVESWVRSQHPVGPTCVHRVAITDECDECGR